MTDQIAADSADRAELLELVTKHRGLFLQTVHELTEDQANATPTVSELSLGGLVKHVRDTEAQWQQFIEQGAPDLSDMDWDNLDPAFWQERANGFRLLPGETLADVLTGYDAVAARTAELIATVDLAERHDLPATPWFEAGASWSNRRALVHVALETAQHAGHADIIRETIDGQKSMG